MNKHTRGPWVAHRSRSDTCEWEVYQPFVNGETVAGEYGIGNEADAHLIAAAPELLEALKHVMGWIDGWAPNFTQDPDWPQHAHYIRAAIAKATGAA